MSARGSGFTAAAITAVLCVSTQAATDGVVTWQLTTDTPVVSLAGTQRTVNWYSFVTVSGNNQGLGAFIYSITVRDGNGSLAGVLLGLAKWQPVYGVAGPSGKPTQPARLTAAGSLGGPGMSVLASAGFNSTPGLLDQCGSSYLTWDPWRPDPANPAQWTGVNTAGVGLAARKSVLLFNPAGTYGVQTGSFDASTLTPGTYTVSLEPLDCSVLQADIDLNQPHVSSVIAPLPAASVQGSSFTFTVTNAPLANRAPRAAFVAIPTQGIAPLPVSFNANGSSDEDGDALAYAWTFGDGQTAAGVTASHTYANADSYTATLTVSDGRGGTDSATAVITVEAGGTAGPPGFSFCGAGVAEAAVLCALGLLAFPRTRRR